MGFAAEAGEINPQAVVMAFDGEGVGLALQMTGLGKGQAIGVPEVGAEGDVAARGSGAARQRAVSVPRSPSVQPQTFLVARSIAHHNQQAVFFGPHKSRARRPRPTQPRRA